MLPTEPIGSIPRPPELLDALQRCDQDDPALDPMFERAVADTISRFEATGSPVITDGEQRKYHNFWTYGVEGLPNTDSNGFRIPFAAGHARRMPRLTAGPFRYRRYADRFLTFARRFTELPLKQAVISPSALSLMYPEEGLANYSRDEFIADLVREHVLEVRRCLAAGASTVQVDFTEGRLAVKIDPTGELLSRFIELNNLALDQFTEEERSRIGIHTCAGADRDSTHSADIDYAELLPSLFLLRASHYYIALAREDDPQRALRIAHDHLPQDRRVFIGVIDPLAPRVETPGEVRDRVLQAARLLPVDRMGTTDDCGFAPFCDDQSTSRETAFAKIRARVEGTALASRILGV